MKLQLPRLLLGLGLGVLGCLVAITNAATVSPVQSTAKPSGLTVIAQVDLAGSDAQSQTVQALVPGYVQMLNTKLPEGVAFTGAGINKLDPQRLYFMFDYAPRVYFLYEGACYTNALGATIATVSAPSSQILTGNTFTIFPNTHSSISHVCASGSGTRSQSEPLLAGDFVQLPTVKAGQQLSFFLMANLSGNTPQDTYYNGTTNNVDNFQHMIAFFPDNSQYIIIAFEDMLNGGDKDCNDVCFVVDVGGQNAALWRNPNTFPK
jgi:hypothetical protein